MGWKVHADIGPDRTVHVWPESDLRNHETDGGFCWCGPRLEDGGAGVLVSHRDQLDREVRP